MGLGVARIVDFKGAPLGHDLLGRKWSLRVSPSWKSPPILDGLNLGRELPRLLIEVRGRMEHVAESHDTY